MEFQVELQTILYSTDSEFPGQDKQDFRRRILGHLCKYNNSFVAGQTLFSSHLLVKLLTVEFLGFFNFYFKAMKVGVMIYFSLILILVLLQEFFGMVKAQLLAQQIAEPIGHQQFSHLEFREWIFLR
jgi:hypothetical protein